MNKKIHPLQLIGSLLIDYFRWTQLVPMITLWSFALLMVFMLFFVNHQDETLDGVGAIAEWASELPVVGPALLNWAEEKASDDDTLHFSGEDLKVGAMRAWAILSLVFMVISWLVSVLFGPFQPWPLKRKLTATGLACVVLMAGFVGVYFLSPETFNGPLSGWLLNFAGIALLIFLVSAWCLSIAHALGLLNRLLTGSHYSEPLR